MSGNGSEPAFPTDGHDYDGLTKREWFAGQAMLAMADRRWEAKDGMTATEVAAKACYAHADAMLKAGQK